MGALLVSIWVLKPEACTPLLFNDCIQYRRPVYKSLT